MPLKTPSFWAHRGIIAYLLLPFSCIYLAVHRLKIKLTKPYKSAVPVLCIGGVVAGGSGKTPVVHAILALIREHALFENPVILTRGYGGELKGPTHVDLSVHTARDVGDEAILHASHAPTIVSRNRVQGAILAGMMDADIIVMDDGLQNMSLEKTLSFLVIDKEGLGNFYLLPAGPLREPLEEAQSKCALVIDKTRIRVVSTHNKAKSYYGFAGLGRPAKFKRTLEENGFTLAGFTAFADHHPYTAKDIERLKSLAQGARLITTEKDIVKIPEEFRGDIDVLRIVHDLDNPAIILDHLKRLGA